MVESEASSPRSMSKPVRKPGVSTPFPLRASQVTKLGRASPGRSEASEYGTPASYDPDLNLTYWGTGNPNPNGSPDSRLGDNLYSDSVVALDADTGKLKWYYQFTPHDDMDWDSTQVPVLADLKWQGRRRKLILVGEQKRLDVRAGPDDRRISVRKTICDSELDVRFRRKEAGPYASRRLPAPGLCPARQRTGIRPRTAQVRDSTMSLLWRKAPTRLMVQCEHWTPFREQEGGSSNGTMLSFRPER